ncbi:hypothetical protein ACQPZG_22605 [Streptomyces sp. CA-294286]|uniref:hypothetical protein n=1 Tax=Streptomyces sp. CA-294286 TaxID=3240070 RepID=UPI003D8F051D
MTDNLRSEHASWATSDDRADGRKAAEGTPPGTAAQPWTDERSGAAGVPGADAWTDGDEVDWAGERKPTDAPWLGLVWGVVALLLVAVGVWILFGREALLWAGPAYAAVMAVCLWFGIRLRRRLAAETGIAPHRLPVLVRRIRDERLPRDPRHRRAMAVLARRQVTWTMPLWLYLVAPGAMLLNVVIQAVEGNWWAAAVYCVAAGCFTGSAFLVRRNRGRAVRVLDRIEGSPDAGPGPRGEDA